MGEKMGEKIGEKLKPVNEKLDRVDKRTGLLVEESARKLFERLQVEAGRQDLTTCLRIRPRSMPETA